MDMLLTIVCFLFVTGCLTAIALMTRAGEWAGVGVISIMLIVGIMLFASVSLPENGQIADLKSEIADLKTEIETLKINTDNPAELAAVCLIGASALVGMVFFGICGLMFFQHKIRKSEKMMPESQRVITADRKEITQLYLPAEYQHQGGQPW